MSKAERIYKLLLEFQGKQVGGKKSTRVEVDLSLILQYMEYEDHIKNLEEKLSEYQDRIVRLDGYLKCVKGILDKYDGKE